MIRAILFNILFFSIIQNVLAVAKDTLVIVCFGNSTTSPRKGVEHVYPERMESFLKQKGIIVQVYNAGLPGSHSGSRNDNSFHRIAHAMDRFDTAVINKKPNLVIISFGINDSWQDKGKGTEGRLTKTLFKKNLQYFIDKCGSVGARVILMSPNPLGEKYERFRHKQLNEYRKICLMTAHENKLPIIDVWKVFEKHARQNKQPIDTLLLDGMHPNDQGHILMTNALTPLILRQHYEK